MIWIVGLPLPPSANSMYETNVHKYWTKRKGKPFLGVKTSRRKSRQLDDFQIRCELFKRQHAERLKLYSQEIQKWIDAGMMVEMDSYCVFERSRIWTKDNKPQQIDADNFRKALQDCVFQMLDIDDKHCFRGNIEKVTCIEKDLECSIVSLRPAQARSLEQIKQMIMGFSQPISPKIMP